MKTLHLTSLGCAKNLVDSEMMLGSLELSGWQAVEDPAEAELLLINTCGFIRPAVEETVDEILHLAEYKQADPSKKLVVTGCLVQRYGSELHKELPEVDLWVGIDDEQRIAELISALPGCAGLVLQQPCRSLISSAMPRRLSTPPFRSWLKITEGCNNRCTYCMIPSIRGDLRSRSVADLAIEARALAQGGVKELSLIAQDLTAYGTDLGSNLAALLRQLLAETDIPWLRLLYLYPASVSDELLDLMAEQPRIVPYLDIPFQHVSSNVLQRMNRRYGQQDLDQLIARIRKRIPHCALRTTMMVGFPGETEQDVAELLECLASWQLDHVGVFPYEDEEGAAASNFQPKVTEEEKQERFVRVMELQAEISQKRLQQLVGQEVEVLVEGVSEETELLLEGRARFQAPEIDGCVYINEGTANPGDIVKVRIAEAHTYDLVGGIIA
ncbi:MAG: SSU ribosomal protein S12P methylthiotransferase [Candidatus Electronema aureum]|uniref:Ribosomal protein uS12 methylthiotransferase RimO n=1 Tax=Candidatus Electronema aureum TaxID=2005002 RepID=A0A521G2Q5_9BACT|nr:MAG: SSU ribosomal protein S12P methylthiotransferase [Candidatus Electronema aureum]